MDIAEIETFVAIAELGGFTRAARRLNRTQPAISRRLGLLEHELGAPVFERIRGAARLTEAGRAFLPHAEAVLAALKDGREAVGFPAPPGEPYSSGHVLARQLIRAGLDAAEIVVIDSLTAQKRLAQAGFGLALVPDGSVREELRRGQLVALDVPAMRTTIPIVAVYRRNGYLSPAATALLDLLTGGALRPKARRERSRGRLRRPA